MPVKYQYVPAYILITQGQKLKAKTLYHAAVHFLYTFLMAHGHFLKIFLFFYVIVTEIKTTVGINRNIQTQKTNLNLLFRRVKTAIV